MRLFLRLPLFLSFFLTLTASNAAIAQSRVVPASREEVEELRQTVRELAGRVSALEAELNRQKSGAAVETASLKPAVLALPGADIRSSVESVSSSGVTAGRQVAAIAGAAPAQSSPAAAVLPALLPGGATLNYTLDGYYEYDFNHPIGRVQYLRPFDVLSNVFSINQADLVFDWQPDLASGRRYGMRVDLQFGQATETLQGNPANEPRPEVYRNIFQAYGTYVVPLGKGLTVDVGKWASSLGIEGNYTKDQMNYSRSFYFDYLPFYHEGVRASYKVNDKLTLNYWLVNGTNQSEPTNSYKDELFGFTAQPAKTVSWNFNYYIGQDHPDVMPATGCVAPVQPGLCLAPIDPAPDGKAHIFDSYVTWNAAPKLTFALEGDYVIQRLWANAAPGESSAPAEVYGGVGYARYQFKPRMALAGRGEYLNDKGGLYTGRTQVLNEFTGTYEYKFGDGFLARVEFRRDSSNVPFFLTNKPGVLAKSQPTFGIGMVWWYGGKQGAW
jgi:hypothetical protein